MATIPGGQTANFTISSLAAGRLAQAIIQASGGQNVAGGATGVGNGYGVAWTGFGASSIGQNVTGTQTTSLPFFTATNTAPATITGGGPATIGVLAGQGATYLTGSSGASQIIAGDNTNSAIGNNNVAGSLVAVTGQGFNALNGAGFINAFETSQGGFDTVTFADPGIPLQANALTTGGQDTVSIFGPASPGTQTQSNLIVANGTGTDSVSLYNSASLTFINNSAGTSTVNAGAGSTVGVGGTGATLVNGAMSGNDTLNVNASSGNVTLAGGAANDTFNFQKFGTAASSAQETVQNFTSSDSVVLTGYGASSVYTSNVVNGSTVLTLNDKTTITFTGVSDASQVTSHITLK